jgi:magnesium chelatase family protein
MGSRIAQRLLRIDDDAWSELGRAYEAGTLSARGRHRVVRVAQTIADLDGRDRIRRGDVLLALSLRQRTESEPAMAA